MCANFQSFIVPINSVRIFWTNIAGRVTNRNAIGTILKGRCSEKCNFFSQFFNANEDEHFFLNDIGIMGKHTGKLLTIMHKYVPIEIR